MNNEQREKLGVRLIGLGLLVLAIIGALIVVVMLTGCDRDYLPWVSNPWPSESVTQGDADVTENILQAPAEDFCDDNREVIDQYRRFLELDYVWPGTDADAIRMRQYCRRFVVQYDRLCFL